MDETSNLQKLTEMQLIQSVEEYKKKVSFSLSLSLSLAAWLGWSTAWLANTLTDLSVLCAV